MNRKGGIFNEKNGGNLSENYRRKEYYRKQNNRGRPCSKTTYKIIEKPVYAIAWARNEAKLKEESRTDGVFPLLTSDTKLSALESLKAYKYQPRLEKRFTQFKVYITLLRYCLKNWSVLKR